ncbi:MAG TPA: hypothetical protein VJ938_09630, partial [Acidimicrobiia bacterium]|nr:hypothetical protein [Acidimicrobiia bacterium]
LHYERLKETGELPIVGVNTYLSAQGSPFQIPDTLIRASNAAKDQQIANLEAFQQRNQDHTPQALERLAAAATAGHNTFDALMDTTKTATLGQITHALYQVGGQYRRNM